jgi:hypothetical protein
MQITGTILDIAGKTISGDNNQYSKQQITLDCSESINGREYPNQLIFQFSNKNCDKLLNRKRGEEVTITFQPQGRFYQKEGETKHFQYLNAWEIVVKGTAPAVPAPQANGNTFYNPAPENVDDLPF